MSLSRFRVLDNNPLTVWDTHEKKAIHLGSKIDAMELCYLLNSLQDRIKKLSLSNLRNTTTDTPDTIEEENSDG